MRYAISLVGLFLLGSSTFAQSSEQQVYDAESITFYGLDFSFFKLIHEEGFVDKNGKHMCKTLPFKYFPEWNEIFLIERGKFNLSDYFGYSEYSIDMDKVNERNKAYAFEEDCIIEDENYEVGPADMEAAIRQYGSQEDEPVGLVVFVESFCKTTAKGYMKAIFFNPHTHKILKTERLEGAPGGSGFRNYWVNAIHTGLISKAKEYKQARKGN